MKKNNAIVFGLSSDHVFAIACVIMDIKKLCPNLIDEIVVLHDGICKNDQKILHSIMPTKFILYEFPLKGNSVLNSRSIKYFTKMVFTKFECLRLLEDYKNVMWLDYDIVVQKDISELFLPDTSGIKMIPGGLTVRDQLYEAVNEFNMEVEGICGSTFVFQDNLKNYKEMHSFCYEMLEKYCDLLYLGEQGIFDFMIQKFDLQVTTIDPKIYTPHPSDLINAKDAKVIHAYGQPKFWNGIHNAQWVSNYKRWLMLGGSRFKNRTPLKRLLSKMKELPLMINSRWSD